MAEELAGVDLKIERAKRHTAELKETIKGWLEHSGHRFTLDLEPDTRKHALTPHDVPEVAPEWSLQVGEILYNLRSALDHLAWRLVELDGKIPTKYTQFPVHTSPVNKKGKPIAIQLSPAVEDSKILKALEETQPYKGADGRPRPYHRSPLWMVHRLNIIDKHRLLLVVACMPDIGSMWWGSGGREQGPDFRGRIVPAKNGEPVAWFDFHGREPPPDFDPHPSLVVTLNEGELAHITLTPLSGLLEVCCSWVEEYIVGERFRPLFP